MTETMRLFKLTWQRKFTPEEFQAWKAAGKNPDWLTGPPYLRETREWIVRAVSIPSAIERVQKHVEAEHKEDGLGSRVFVHSVSVIPETYLD